jgi:putative hydrolase of the HAD superfamily
MFDVLAFDADDTLWHTEELYAGTQARFMDLLAAYHSREWIEQKLYDTEMRNLGVFGYGIKGFTLSMIETAIELTEGRIHGSEIQALIDLAKEMVRADVRLLDHVAETIARLARRYRLMLVTKGDLFDQETKIARSGLGSHFAHVEIVSDKTAESYAALLARHHVPPARFLMVGNSLRSDVLPVVAVGARAVYIPYHVTWAHEVVTDPGIAPDAYFTLEHIGLLPDLLEQLEAAT